MPPSPITASEAQAVALTDVSKLVHLNSLHISFYRVTLISERLPT